MKNNLKKYKEVALKIRKTVLKMIYRAQTSHIGSNFSCIDILTVLYLNANIDKGLEKNRDRIIISKGWAAAAVYALLAERGIIPEKDLETFCQPGSRYIGLTEPSVKGIEFAGGSMGFGLPAGVGFALAKKIKKEGGRIYVLMSDGEMNCGTTWESALIASHHRLNNLLVIIDYNGLQAMGKTNQILKIEPLEKKWISFGWQVEKINGHNFSQIERSLLRKNKKPLVIIAKTIKGYPISFMSGNNLYHYKNLSKNEYQKALKELNLWGK